MVKLRSSKAVSSVRFRPAAPLVSSAPPGSERSIPWLPRQAPVPGLIYRGGGTGVGKPGGSSPCRPCTKTWSRCANAFSREIFRSTASCSARLRSWRAIAPACSGDAPSRPQSSWSWTKSDTTDDGNSRQAVRRQTQRAGRAEIHQGKHGHRDITRAVARHRADFPDLVVARK